MAAVYPRSQSRNNLLRQVLSTVVGCGYHCCGTLAPSGLGQEFRKSRELQIKHRLAGKNMWHLIEDFFDQNLVMKAFLGLGWLSILIMVCSLIQQVIA